MKIRNISSLISSFTQTSGAPSVEEPELQSAGTEGASTSVAQSVRTEEAAKVASNFGVSDSDNAQQRDKVQRLKEQVGSGNYNPDSTEIAKAFLKEIGTA